MQTPTGDLELLNHFSVLIYPFLHDVTGRHQAERLEVLERHWAPWWCRLADGDLAQALDDTSFFLPYIRGLLYPETVRLRNEPPGLDFANWARCIRSWSARGLTSFCPRLAADCILRLTCREALSADLARFTLAPHRETAGRGVGHAEMPVQLDWVDAVLFPSGVGFLLLKVRLRLDAPRMAQLIELNRLLRLVHPPTLSWTLPLMHFARTGAALRVRDLMNFLTQGLVGPVDVLGPLEAPAENDEAAETPYTDTEAGRACGERCHLLSYACVGLGEAGRAQLPAGVFGSGEDRLLYEYAACIGLGETVHNPMWVPSPEQAERVCRDNRLAMWRCWKAMTLKESLVFLATDDLAFNRKALPHNIENDYLALYLYTLYQKFQLSLFSNTLMRKVAQAREKVRAVRGLLERFVAFRSQFWFNEVTRKPLGGDLYRKLQDGLEVQALYQLVTCSVKEAKEYHEEAHTRHVQFLRDVLTWIFGPVAVVFGAVRVFLTGAYPLWAKALLLSVVAAGSVGVLIGLRQRRARLRSSCGMRRPRRKRQAGTAVLAVRRPPDEERLPLRRAG
jgi:hypothetical protein